MLNGRLNSYQTVGHKQLRSSQRLVLGLYALLLAGFFPFICWGSMADEHHPHRLPHFVFFEPTDPIHTLVTSELRTSPQTVSALESLHHSHGHDHTGAAVDVGTTAHHAPLSPTGRATPTLVIFSLLLLIFYPALIFVQGTEPHFIRYAHQRFPASVLLTVPHPPPRLAN